MYSSFFMVVFTAGFFLLCGLSAHFLLRFKSFVVLQGFVCTFYNKALASLGYRVGFSLIGLIALKVFMLYLHIIVWTGKCGTFRHLEIVPKVEPDLWRLSWVFFCSRPCGVVQWGHCVWNMRLQLTQIHIMRLAVSLKNITETEKRAAMISRKANLKQLFMVSKHVHKALFEPATPVQSWPQAQELWKVSWKPEKENKTSFFIWILTLNLQTNVAILSDEW